MSAGIAHELKNSLATISGYAQLLRDAGLSPENQEFAKKLVGETRALTQVVTDFLNLSKPLALAPHAVDVREQIQQADCPATIEQDLGLQVAVIYLVEQFTAAAAGRHKLAVSAEGNDGINATFASGDHLSDSCGLAAVADAAGGREADTHVDIALVGAQCRADLRGGTFRR